MKLKLWKETKTKYSTNESKTKREYCAYKFVHINFGRLVNSDASLNTIMQKSILSFLLLPSDVFFLLKIIVFFYKLLSNAVKSGFFEVRNS